MDGSPAQLQDKVIFGKGIFYFGGNRGRGQARKPGQVWQVGQGSKEKVIPSGNLKYGKRNPPFEQLIFTFKTPLRADFPIVSCPWFSHDFPLKTFISLGNFQPSFIPGGRTDSKDTTVLFGLKTGGSGAFFWGS